MAWRWQRSGVPFRLLTRIGDDRPEVFQDFLDRHDIPAEPDLVEPGRSASIDIVIQPDLQPWMDNYVEGVWATLRLRPDEEALVGSARTVHLVLSRARSASSGAWRGRIDARRRGHGDSRFRHYTVERFADTMTDVDVGFVGWPGGLEDPAVDGSARSRTTCAGSSS
jgi:hypothetical protein